MTLATRLQITLLPAVVVIMGGFGWWALRSREQAMVTDARQETRAFATGLALAFGERVGTLSPDRLQFIVDEVSREPGVHGVLIYDETGEVLAASPSIDLAAVSAGAELQEALSAPGAVSFQRTLGEETAFAALRSIRTPDGTVLGVVEVTQDDDPIRQVTAGLRRRFLINTLLLVVVVAGLGAWMVREAVSRPIRRFAEGIRNRIEGEHVEEPLVAPGELATLGADFARLSDALDASTSRLLQETRRMVALERELRHARTMAAVGSLASRLAHEIAGPLNVISGRAEMLARDADRSPGEARSLDIIGNQIRRISGLVQNLLDFARRPEPRLRSVELTEVVGGAVEFLDEELARKRIDIEVEHESPVWVTADPEQLHQVLLNLLMNAIQAVEAADENGERRIRVTVAGARPSGKGQRGATVTVNDSGPGFDEPTASRLFEPFFTTRKDGTGLGLAICQEILGQHGGRLEGEGHSELGGAIFTLHLPAEPERTNE